MKIINKNISLLFCILLLSFSFKFKNFLNKPQLTLTKEDTAFNLDSKLLSIFSLGQTRLISSLLWVTTLLESDIEHYKGDDANSWMFLRFKTISDIDPLFLKNYQLGGQYLSIVKDDLVGAEYIFKKGLVYYQNNYEILLNIAFLYGFELGDYKKAFKYYNQLSKFSNSPPFIKSLLPKLKYSETNNLGLAKSIINEQLKVTQDPLIKKKLNDDLYNVTALIDLDCLNSKKNEKCNEVDHDGNSYYLNGKKYRARREVKPYKLYKN